VWLAAAMAGLIGMTAALVPLRAELSMASVVLLYLVPVVITAATGGRWLPAVTAVVADLVVNFFYVPPYHTLVVESRDHLIVLFVYLLVAGTISIAVDVAARHRARAGRSAVEAALLARASTTPIDGSAVGQLLDQVRSAYRMTTVALTDGAQLIEQVGPAGAGTPALEVPAGPTMRLVAWGPGLFAEDRTALTRLAAAAARAVETRRLAGQAARATELAHIDEVRAALLNAVGHDLRTPLAGIKAAISSLRQPDVRWHPDDRAELLATVEESTDRLSGLVENLLSLSRLQAGVLSVHARPTPLDAVVAQALLNTDTGGTDIEVDVPDDLPPALADPGLLERVVANLVANACAASPPDRAVRVSGASDASLLRLQVIDHGPGIPVGDRAGVFAPFQRLNDSGPGGLGLGLAIARGFTEAQRGQLTLSDTPGGGLTATITMPAVQPVAAG